jgi:FAD-dependent urate hydroxylase
VPVEHHKRFTDAEVGAGGEVVARFADGSEARGDVLIGADGIHSRARGVIDLQAPTPRYTGLGNAGGFTSRAAVDLPPGTYQMMFGKRAFFGFTVSPAGEIWWFANPPRKQEMDRAELAAMTTDRWKEYLAGLFADDLSPAVEIIRATEGKIIGTNQHDMPRVPVWRRGPMVIIGDAAHAVSPSSGQGASMAAEDAVALAGCLGAARSDIPAALAAYESRRRERVERVVAYGARIGGTKTVGPAGRMLRDLVLPSFIKRMARADRRTMAWLFQHHAELTPGMPPASR